MEIWGHAVQPKSPQDRNDKTMYFETIPLIILHASSWIDNYLKEFVKDCT